MWRRCYRSHAKYVYANLPEPPSIGRNMSRAHLVVASALFAWRVAAGAAPVPAIPDLTGKVLTVQGPIAPEHVGHALPHEHLLLDFSLPLKEPDRWKLAGRQIPTSATDVGFYNAPLRLDMLSDVVHGKMNHDNYVLDDEQLAIREAGAFKRAGGGTIVDVTSMGLGRNPEGLRRIAQATGLNIVMGSSWYTKGFHPADMDGRSVETLTAEVVRDITVGADGTGIRAGIIGEVGTTGSPLTANEVRIIQAAGRASRLTGAAVSLHTSAARREHMRVLDLLAAEGTDLTRVIVGHSDPLADDIPYLTSLLHRGAYVQFDVLGRPPVITRTRPTDAEVGDTIKALIDAGFVRQLLLSHDICTKTSLQAYGGTGYSYVELMFTPYLKQLGVTDAQIRTMVEKNPTRLLTFVAPKPLLARSR